MLQPLNKFAYEVRLRCVLGSLVLRSDFEKPVPGCDVDPLFAIFLYPCFNICSFDCQELEPVVGVIVAQIRALFGLPPTFVKNPKAGVYGLPAAVTGITHWYAALSLT